MLRKDFIAPFWFMLVLGIVACCLSTYGIHMIRVYAPTYALSTLRLMGFFFLPAIIFIEAIMYWMVRKRNVYRKATWAHILLFALAYFTPFIKSMLFVFYDAFAPTPDYSAFVRGSNLAQTCLFWGLTILAHIYFARTLIRIFSTKQASGEGTGQGPENMLDDVLG